MLLSLEFNNPIFLVLGGLFVIIGLLDLLVASSSLSLIADGFSIVAGLVVLLRYFVSQKKN